jgi:hypothetical protein
MTPFQQALISASEGKLKTPTVSTASGNVNYFGYQLAVHKYNLSIMAAGMQCRGITFTQIKKYYGLKGRTAKDCLGQMDQLISTYKQALNGGYGDESIAETMNMNSRMN